MTKTFYVYMMTNRSRVVLYTGITNSLVRRVWEHQNGDIEGFTKKYRVNRLVYYEISMIHGMQSHARKRSKAGGAPRKMHW